MSHLRAAASVLFIIALTTLVCTRGCGADLAVVPNADDSGNGSAERPFASLAKALARAGSGDTVYLARGAVYRETGLVFKGGVTVKGAGSGDKPPPLITASVRIEGFKPWAKNAKVLAAPCERKALECYVDGAFQVLARFPNLNLEKQAWLRAAKGSTPDVLLCPERAQAPGAASGRWKGAQVRWRRWSWWWETRPIGEDDGSGKLALGADGRFHDGFTGVGSAFYVDNCLAELDAPGEWFWDEAAKMLYVYPPAGSDPAKLVIEAVLDPAGCTIGGGMLDGVGFARFASVALKLEGKSLLTGCLFQDVGGNAIVSTWGSSGTRISGCAFRDVRDLAISWNEDPKGAGGTVIERNTFDRIGDRPGYGGSGSWHGAGIIVFNGKGVMVRLNRFSDCGYDGVILNTPGCTVERNVLVRCMSQMNDGAAIGVCANGSIVRENIVLDTIGNLETSQPFSPLGHGIWTEFLGDLHDSQLIGNTVFGSGGFGIYLPNNRSCQVRENVLMGNRRDGLHLGGYEKDKGPQKHVIADNVLVALDPSRRIPGPVNGSEPEQPRGLGFEPGIDYGTLSGTVFVVSGTAPAIGGKQSYDDPAAWAKDEHWGDPAAKLQKATPLLLINDTEQAHDFVPPSGSWTDLAGKPIGKAVTVAPYRSAVLLRRGADGGALPPYLTASGIDYRAPSLASATEIATAKAAKATKPSASASAAIHEDAEARHSYVSTKPKSEAWARYVGLLRDRVSALSMGRSPAQFEYSAMKQRVSVIAVQGDQATLKLGDEGGQITAALFGAKLTVTDACRLALDAQRADQPEQYALAAFFARCADDGMAYERCLAHAGALAADVESGFSDQPN